MTCYPSASPSTCIHRPQPSSRLFYKGKNKTSSGRYPLYLIAFEHTEILAFISVLGAISSSHPSIALGVQFAVLLLRFIPTSYPNLATQTCQSPQDSHFGSRTASSTPLEDEYFWLKRYSSALSHFTYTRPQLLTSYTEISPTPHILDRERHCTRFIRATRRLQNPGACFCGYIVRTVLGFTSP